MNSKTKFTLLLFLIILSLSTAAFSGYFGFNTNALIKIVALNPILSAIIYNLIFIGATSFSFSVGVMSGFGILMFSWPMVFVYSMVGIMGSSIIDFYISRKLGKNYVRRYLNKHGGRIEEFEDVLEKNTFKTT
ncbi:MAG: VTT domain-containing protein, partial [Nanoarchaeota archaeon]|nr:VTT domain-containing protein [Nanoarchaeota archaeon]